MPLPRITSTTNFAGLSLARTTQWLPSLAKFGVAAGLGLLYFASDVPIVRRDVFSYVPGLRNIYPAPAEEE